MLPGSAGGITTGSHPLVRPRWGSQIAGAVHQSLMVPVAEQENGTKQRNAERPREGADPDGAQGGGALQDAGDQADPGKDSLAASAGELRSGMIGNPNSTKDATVTGTKPATT